MSHPLSREIEIEPAHTTLLFVDVQNYNCLRNGGEYAKLSEAEIERRYGYFFRMLTTLRCPIWCSCSRPAAAAASKSTYTVIESLTSDGRDRSLDYKITGFNVPKGSPDAKMVDELAPAADEILFPKTSSSVFISTNIDYVLRNLGTRLPDYRGMPHRSMRRLGDSRRLRLGISRDRADRCLRDLVGGTA